MARTRTTRQLPRGEHELPAQLLRSPRVLPLQSVGQLHPRHAASQVALVQPASPLKLPLQVSADGSGQHHHLVLVTLATPDHDLPM